MWIRSQDKTKLINIDMVVVDETIIRCCTNDFSVYMGEYSTKEKAFKVLDMIHDFIQNDGCFINGYDVIKKHIFQMPQDDEVQDV